MKVKFTVNTGFPAAKHKSTEEVPDETTDEELDEMAQEFLFDHIEVNWEKV